MKLHIDFVDGSNLVLPGVKTISLPAGSDGIAHVECATGRYTIPMRHVLVMREVPS